MNGVPRRAVVFFCADLDLDPVALRVFGRCAELFPLEPSGVEVDGFPVLLHRDAHGHEFALVRTAEVLSHDYPRYLPLLAAHFSDADVALLVNWHEGANAPDHILMAHTTGDVVSGHFGPADPRLTMAMLRALERERVRAGLEAYRTVTEATHWSGIPVGHDPELLTRYGVPLLDVEIGSTPECWSDPAAVDAVARAVTQVFDDFGEGPGVSLLCVGGIHFEPSFRDAVLGEARHPQAFVSHILANHWLMAGGYDQPGGDDKLETCTRSILGSIDAIIFHDSVKGGIKANVRELAARLGVPVFNHRRLRDPQPLLAETP